MKTEKTQTLVRIVTLFLFAVLCLLAFASCMETEPAGTTVEETEAPSTTGTPSTTEAPDVTETPGTTPADLIVTEPEVGEGIVPVRTADGAGISFAPTGLRFTGLVAKEYYDALKAAYGEGNITVGILVAPTNTLTNGTIDRTKETTVRLTASSVESDGDDYRFDCVLAFSEEKDYGRSYSAVAFVEVRGELLRCAEYSAERNAVLFSVLINAGLLDLTDTQDANHKYAVEVDGKNRFSPYTKRQRELMTGYLPSCSFTVMSYNIEVYDSDNGWEGRNPAKALETVQEQLPDIVGFQEVNAQWETMLNSLEKTCGYTRLPGEYCKYNFEKNEIFFRTDKFTYTTQGTRSFKQVGNEMGVTNVDGANLSLDKIDRIFHYVVLEHKETGRKVLVVNTHLHYGGTGTGHEEDDKVRRYQIRVLLAWLNRQANNYPDQIVMGDMNASYASGEGKTTMALYTDGGLSLALKSAYFTDDVGGTLANGNRATRAQWTFDYIMTRGGVGASYYTVVNNPVDADGKYPSDHIPVLAKIYWK